MKSRDEVSNVRIINPKKLLDEGITGVVLTGTFQKEVTEERVQRATGKKFISTSFTFLDEEGKIAVINSTGHLSYLMKKQEVQPGDKLSILYFGKDKEDRHQFELIAA